MPDTYSRDIDPRSGLGTGQVYSTEKPVIHFGSPVGAHYEEEADA